MQSDFLMHYGIPGMKWGVRRFQEKGSSKRTPVGKIRYAHVKAEPSKEDAEKKRVKASSSFAKKIYQKAARVEPRITKAVTSAVTGTGAKMYRLKDRLKTHASLTRKINTDSQQKGISIEQAAKEIKDSIRYTSLSNDADYTDNYFAVKDSLEKQGYTETRCRNYFDLYKQGKAKHKQITSVYADKHGNQFEVQFQTPSSIKAKEAKTPLYEEIRKPDISQKQKDVLEKKMDGLAKHVKNPKNVYTIRSHG